MEIKIQKESVIIEESSMSLFTLLFFGVPSLIVLIMTAVTGVISLFSISTAHIGALFFALTIVEIWVIKHLFMATVPFKWVLYPIKGGSISAVFTVLGFKIKNTKFDNNYKVFASPVYSHGDWGYSLGIMSSRTKKFRLSRATLLSDNLRMAKEEVEKVINKIAVKLKISYIMIDWEKYEP